MAVIAIVHEDGRTATVTQKRAEELRGEGWTPASELPPPPPTARRRRSAAPEAPVVIDDTTPAPEATPEHEEQVQ